MSAAPSTPDASSSVAARLRIALLTPLALLLLFGLVLGRQFLLLSREGEAVAHSQQVLAVEHQTEQQVTDHESGARGYLLTHDPRFRAAFDRATPRASFERLERLTAADPEPQAHLAETRQLHEAWLASISPALVTGTRSEDDTQRDAERLASVRAKIREVTDRESERLRERVDSLRTTTTQSLVLFLALLAGSAVALMWLSRRQLRSLAGSFEATIASADRAREVAEREEWIRAGLARLVEELQGERTLEQLGAAALSVLTPLVEADVGAFFGTEGGSWRRLAGHGLDARAAGPATFAAGEGLVGQVATEGEPRHLREVPPDGLRARAGTVETSPVELALVPARLEGITHAVLELGFLRPASDRAIELLGRIGPTLAFTVRSSEYKQRLRELLDTSQRQSEELQTQQEELRVANEELESQSQAQRLTQRQLEQQQAELEQTNDHLVQQSSLLEKQNERLTATQAEVTAKSHEVERASQYKSDFLSNMSHELRTPLNSSLILSKLLADNRDGNLTAEQVKSAATIHAAGNDLLALIDDILDLSKIEAGKMDVHPAPAMLDYIRATLLRTFEPLARNKSLRFTVTRDPAAPDMLETDVQRVEQVLKNLISNALKFTAQGEVEVTFRGTDERVEFAVRDTGIGIPSASQAIIFEAFRQADGTTSRKYGGTGLGLSISRELARLLGGHLSVTSAVGQGSTFTLSLPHLYAGPRATPEPERSPAVETLPASQPPSSLSMLSVPASLEPGQRRLLVIEDDAAFASILANEARAAGFACLVAGTARSGFHLAKTYAPAGIVLDLGLPDHTGLSVLDRLKRDPLTRHIPVHIVSGHDDIEKGLAMGAMAYLKKPVDQEQLAGVFRALDADSTRRLRRVLVVDDDQTLRESVVALLERSDVEFCAAGSVDEALARLREGPFDCVITDLFPDRRGHELLAAMAAATPYSLPPVIVYTGRDLSSDEEQELRKYSRTIIVKGARSPERLLDEVTLFLHQIESELPARQRQLLEKARHREAFFEGRTILVVEDDARNIFALTNVLEPKGARVAIARNGKEALTALKKEPHVDLVLMDLMMPEMDGLEATREIRKEPRWAKLPIIALTAKAMKDDQEKCLAAGANDYLAKPLDVEMLLSLLRVWMPRS